MYHIIGIGKRGHDVAQWFSEYPKQYKVYRFAHKADMIARTRKDMILTKWDTPEEYEEFAPDTTNLFKVIKEKDEVFVILKGSEMETAGTLKILETIKDRKIHILYIKEDPELLYGVLQLQDRTIYNVLQEYARSKVFETMTVFDMPLMENKLFPEANPLDINYHVNETIFKTVDGLNVCKNTKPILKQIVSPYQSTTIQAMGLLNPDDKNEKMFFDLDNVHEIEYYCYVDSKNVAGMRKFIDDMKEMMKEKRVDKTLIISYNIYETQYGVNYGYVVKKSNMIQRWR